MPDRIANKSASLRDDSASGIDSGEDYTSMNNNDNHEGGISINIMMNPDLMENTETNEIIAQRNERLQKLKPKHLKLQISDSNDTSFAHAVQAKRQPAMSSTALTTVTATSIFPYEQCKDVKRLNIGFENLRFRARLGFWKQETKTILNGLTGEFLSGKLTAIVGPSGAGKSTFLNILSGYTAYGYSGSITINNQLRDIRNFKLNVALITQDTSLQPYLTVKEAMHFATNLKLDSNIGDKEKRERAIKILEAVGLYEHRNTRTRQLSGGQQKRLSLALELVSNPPVLILDEPTSGLDSSTTTQCITLLKQLASEGRTVICTIHQPSALIFAMFDHLYAIAGGKCIYSGATQNLLRFLSEVELPCPASYNPADYLMEIATNDYGPQNHKLVNHIKNGRNKSYIHPILDNISQDESDPTASLNCTKTNLTGQLAPLTPIKELSINADEVSIGDISSQASEVTKRSNRCRRSNDIYATTFLRQSTILLQRAFLILWRDKSLTTMRFTINFVTALLIGSLYYNIGNDAGNALNNFRYCFYSIMFIMYTAFSSILVKFPLEMPIICREHFNHWYSLRAYYVAMTLADIPVQLVCSLMYLIITYYLTNQPAELFRLTLFCLIGFLTALVGQSIGLTIGTTLNIRLASILGPFFICPFLTFSGFFLQEKDTPQTLRWLFKTSFLKYSFDGSVLSIFGYDRPRLECHDIYCHYSRPKLFLRDVDMLDANCQLAIIFLIVLYLILRIITFYIMSFKLKLFR